MPEKVFTTFEEWKAYFYPELTKKEKIEKLRKEWGEGKFLAMEIIQQVCKEMGYPIEYPELL